MIPTRKAAGLCGALLGAAGTAASAQPRYTIREIEYPDAEDEFEAIEAATADLATRHSGLTPPEVLAANHQRLLSAIQLASDSITNALAGLRSTDEGQQRNSGVEAYTQAAADYDTEVTNAHNAAGSDAGG